MTIIIVSVALVLWLGFIGGGWGSKQVPDSHPFYNGKVRLVAHRGVSDQAPENTDAAARRAMELGFQFMEIDLKQSQDHKFYLFHDRDSKRLLGKEIQLNQKTLAQIQQYPLIHNGNISDQYVPELESFLEQFASEITFYFDIKRHGNHRYRDLSDRIYNFLTANGLSDKALIGSDFLFTTYLEFRYPHLHTVFTGPGNWTIVFYQWIPRRFRPDFIISYANEVTAWHLQWLRQRQLIRQRMVYGVDSTNYTHVKNMGIPFLVVEYDPVMNADL